MTTLSSLVTPGNVLTAAGTQAPTNKDLTGSGNTFPVLGGATGFVASGSIGNGATVGINADGTVSVVAGVTEGAGTPVVFESASTTHIGSTFDSTNNKVVIVYQDAGNSNYGTAIVGTVSGTTISFGTAVVFNAGSTQFPAATFDSSNNKVVIAYQDNGNSNYGTAVVGTVSGTSISFGSEVVFDASTSSAISATFDSTNNKVVIVYSDGNNSTHGTAIIGTVSGTSISFGTAVVFNAAGTDKTAVTFDSNSNKAVIAFRDVGNSYYLAAIVGTVSGTSISFGSEIVFETSTFIDYISATFDSTSNKVVIAYNNTGNSNYGTAVVGTVSGTSISFGTPAVFESAATTWISAAFDSSNNKIVIAYVDGGNSNYGTAVVGTVSGTSISFGTPAVFESAYTSWINSIYDTNSNKTVIAYIDGGNSSFGTAAVFQVGSTTAPTYIGLSTQAVSDTDAVTVTTVAGINESQTGLTPDTLYYVNDDGTLTATATNTYAGKAVSATELLVKG